MNSLKDLLVTKASVIDESGVKTDLDIVQAELDRFFESGIKVRSFNDGVVSVTASNSSIASNMRMQQTQLKDDLNSSLKNKIQRFFIKIVQ